MKKVVFPLEILPVSLVGSALFHAAVSVGLLVFGTWIFLRTVSPRSGCSRSCCCLLLCLALGLGWISRSLGVYLRDIGHTVGS